MVQKFITAAALVAGCAFTTSLFAQSQQHFPNSVKYKDTGLKNASGRSGSASIEARALRARDGNVALDVTTGSFDGGNAAGSIDKLQVKIADTTTNYALSGSSVSVPLGNVAWHEPLHIQTNVSGIDGSRVDVVSADEIVKLRPDLAAGSVSGPVDTLAGMPVTFTAAVTERNGDIGARANCVLSVDGTPVDRSSNIWVDAKGSVTCTFGYTFTTVGTKNVTISATDVSPGDYDLRNNVSAAKSVRVYTHAEEFAQYYVEAEDVGFDDWAKFTAPTREDLQAYRGWQDNDLFIGWINEPFDFHKMGFRFKEMSEGRVISDTANQLQYFRDEWWSDSGNSCGGYAKDWIFVDACKQWGITRVGWQKYSGDVTYHSEGWSTQYNPYENPSGGYYSWNWTQEAVNGAYDRIGSDVSLDVMIGDGTHVWRATPSYGLETTTRQEEEQGCDPAPWFTCYTYHYDQVWKRGHAGGWFVQ